MEICRNSSLLGLEADLTRLLPLFGKASGVRRSASSSPSFSLVVKPKHLAGVPIYGSPSLPTEVNFPCSL